MADTKMSDSSSDAASRLADLLDESTSSEKEELKIYEIKKDEDLHFSVKKNSLVNRMRSRMGGGNGGEKEVHLKAKKDLFKDGVWAEIETKEQILWCFITIDDSVTVKVYPSKNSEDELLGVSNMARDKEFSVFFSKMSLHFKSDSDYWFLDAIAQEQVLMKKAEGLVLASMGVVFAFDENGLRACVKQFSEKNVVDCRNTISGDLPPLSFYRGGSIPFVCFDLEQCKYSYLEEESK